MAVQQKILIIDDMSSNIEFLFEILQEKYEMYCTLNGCDALDLALMHRPDLILLDIVMPKISGFEVCGQLKQNEITQHIPVIFLTAKSDSKDIIKGLELGASDYVTKPFNTPELLLRVNTHLSLRQQQQELLERNEALKQANKKRMLAQQDLQQSIKRQEEQYHSISHALRTPTTIIHQYLRFLNKGMECDQPTVSQQNYLNVIDENTQRILKLINQLLDLARLKSELPTNKMQPVALNRIIFDVTQQMQSLLKPEVKLLIEPIDTALYINANSDYLSSILDNLLSNAVKYTDKGTIIVRVEKNNLDVKISIIDTGIGIKPQEKDWVFNPFTRSESVSSKPGTGLGLAITKTLVDLMGGEIGVESQQNELQSGSTFWFTLTACEGNALD